MINRTDKGRTLEKRPELKVPLAAADRILEGLGALCILSLWIFVTNAYPGLPGTIPVHFNAKGIANGFGDRSMVFFLPAIAAVVFFGMSMLNNYPWIFNYPVKITGSNALKQYTYATRLIRFLKFVVSAVFSAISVFMILSAQGKTTIPGPWFVPAALLFILGPVFVYMVLALRAK
jgi:hypothetical protein